MRIDQGLNTARKLLKEVSSRERSAKALMTDTTALTALYEALCSAPYHTSEQKLHCNFDDPFQLVQERRVLKIGDILPAMTRFLFDTDPIRLRFAIAAWHDLDRKLTQKTFDWAIHDALTDSITSVSQPTASVSVVLQFWQGLLLILHKLDKGLITHSLRAMEVYPDVYHLALQHLARYDSEEILENVIKALRVLLLKSPKDFYAAYDAISATTIAEQIFANRAFEGLLARSQQYELVDEIEVPSALIWISPLVQSLPAAHQYEICRSLLHHLFERFQAKNLTKASKLACFRAGLNALLTTLVTFVATEYKINDSTPFIVVNNVLGLVNQYRITVVDCANLGSNNEEDKELTRLGMQVIRNALSLCCKSTLAELEALDSKKDIRHGLNSHSQSIWEAVLDGFRRDNIEMARNVLSGLHPLVGLDKLKPRGREEKGISVEDPLLECKLRFNLEFVQVVEVISRIFERLSDFTPTNLQPLCKRVATAYSIFAGLTPPDQATYEATVEIIKAITGESVRKDAIARLLQESLVVTLRSLAWATHRISKYGSFSALPFLLKTSRDVLDSLCDPQDGLLRTKISPSKEEQGMIVAWWTEQWGAMSTAFQNYENWASGNKAEYMINVCRDIMEYVEALFDQYVVLASILDDSALSIDPKIDRSELSKASRKSLLEHPRETMQYLLVWLRLKDPYLLSTLVSLVCKILRRLGEFDMGINETGLRDVEKLATGGFQKYKVTQLQRAELQSALEEHIGIEIVAETKNFVDSNPGAEDTRFKYSYCARKEVPTVPGRVTTSPSTMSDDVRSLSKSLEQRKPTLDLIQSRQGAKTSGDSSSKKSLAAVLNLKESREKAREDKIRRDASFLAEERAKRAQLGRIPGESSGLSGIGVQGKDHGPPPKESGVMVSDGEVSDDDGSEVKALLAESKEKAKRVSEKDKSMKRALLQEPAGPVRKMKIIRSAGDKRARIVPNMDMLHLSILRWDIFHEGDEPPSDVSFQEVSSTFQTAAEYYKTFYPLLIAEAWRSLSTAREESNFKPFEITVVNRLTVDKFFEVGTSMLIAENRDNNLAEGDIVLLSKGEAPLKDRKKALCLSRVSKVSRKKDVLEVSYRIPVPATGSTALLSNFSPNLKIRGVKITSMTTIEREYAALNSLLYYDLRDEILSAKPSPLLSYPKQTFNQITTIYGVNEGQAKAIWSARDNDGFTLIQG
jgi:senataxin